MVYPGEKYYPEGVRWNAPIPFGTLPDLLTQAAADFGDRPAIEFRRRPISFAGLSAMVDAAASAFLRAGYGKGASIALFLGNTPDHPVSFFGGLKAGARIVHLSPLDGERALSHKLTDSGARVLVTSNIAALLPMALRFLEKGLIDRLIICEDEHWGEVPIPKAPYPQQPAIVTFRAFVEGAVPPAQWPTVVPDDIALLQYTGGTTGLPKGAMLTHRNLTSAVGIYDVWGAAARAARGDVIERVICVLPLFHIYALTVILLRNLKNGNLISMHQRFDVEAVMHDIEVNRATTFPGVPTMWIAIANLPDLDRRDLSSLASCGSGGAPLPVEVAKVFERRTGMKLRSGWGMTETCSPGTSHPADGPDKPGSIGLMLPGIEIDVVALGEPNRVLPPGETGELRIRGPNVTKGYWNRAQETAEVFVGDRFLTGDIGYMDADGYFYLVDRKKDMIISGGFNVYPQMIEQAIYEHPAVHEVIVLGVPDEYRGEAAKAFVTLKPGAASFTLDDLRTFLTGKIGKHELPAALEFRDQLPRTTVGKLSRHELRTQSSPSNPPAATR
ncbi:dicarboxylate--CoA ligase PimA [Bradyrhizobium sp. U87765 SZCCT0131]|uniref:dicarboxylate--CoA ligase PimA n=1 Tax=unclassified Bradyrhizobium TaxID=2631580 RepID=UPI001BA9D736|nr:MULTISPECIES: dicarboxylate--CoA ligase PimA [unclassified Bradyrhizobium]MBR1222132.1 dicarboxylate--CoA ligase PimA [Bradyrhizobium sp. U87765 SZCCT0131]MBR1263670.1 dicarboxylate--CoA ligase PimA [Bradyrhizobium sp. U87765 SZCCT0134]MBR1302760.1 dicarboxylate--CoA ligase PimA [Bradyrhizobium sp. U87765 SZCCT0110]MBR1319920.1 dicarboxylate--CoA ligase PimA [Bradyrhizobium sp. U87765 SZCCT0109]MBR1348967.1 dicarboxylate--CoA ligase PimA [Bradyrhizobium sp. U87765 SZCCT0048]